MGNDLLQGCVAIVTGGSTGIGFECCRALGEAGAIVILTARTEADGEKAEKELRDEGLHVRFMQQDVSSLSSWQQLCSDINHEYDRLDFLVNNAGISMLTPLEEMTPDAFLNIYRINLLGQWYGLKTCTPHILASAEKRGFPGAVVNMSSMLSRIGQAGAIAYCAAKGGLTDLTVAAEEHWAKDKDKIRFRAILPGYTMTPQVEKAVGREAPLVAELAAKVPLRRWGEAEEIARALMMIV
ncbi:MAG: SDR family oxidoreductase, partial [Alphaproteobacteria bacterium]|nr:SDR family oxidoreductase [Alphaproteobacteria bacterium]